MTIATFEAMRIHEIVNLTTFRKNGQAVATPVSLSQADGKLYIVTGVNTGKIKRLRHNPHIQITPCDWKGNPLGDTFDAQARILSKNESRTVSKRAKFGVPAPVMFIFNRLRDLREGGNIYVEICL
ncbi:MAG: PPOX class F420-dependent oxidoreductase [Anaerolineae bacterium]|nr:PPOX class F420-dependent oxidoreductase [Anaerolineae bacterium]